MVLSSLGRSLCYRKRLLILQIRRFLPILGVDTALAYDELGQIQLDQFLAATDEIHHLFSLMETPSFRALDLKRHCYHATIDTISHPYRNLCSFHREVRGLCCC